jgi:hypothetical protein
MKLTPTIKQYIEYVFNNQIFVKFCDDHIKVYYPEYTDMITYENINWFMNADPEYKLILRQEKLKRI